MKVFVTILVNFFLIKNSFCQSPTKSIYQIVLEKNIKNKKFVFGKWNEKGGMETHLKYLGLVKTKKGRILKIVNYSLYWGLAHRATSRILFFNDRNQYLGDYYLTLVSDLPTKLNSGKLIFVNSKSCDCDKKLVTMINLKNGIPSSFFRKCKGQSGDIYAFNYR
ncbi:MAG: hypothetical protein KA319_05935 [Ferruginibacter sp.]|nr:hypothetical protein [Ferruginibacter sp.]